MESHWAQYSTLIQQPKSLSAFLAAFSFDSYGTGCQRKPSVLFTHASAKPLLPTPPPTPTSPCTVGALETSPDLSVKPCSFYLVRFRLLLQQVRMFGDPECVSQHPPCPHWLPATCKVEGLVHCGFAQVLIKRWIRTGVRMEAINQF